MKRSYITSVISLVTLVGCSSPPPAPVVPAVVTVTEKDPGAVDHVWEEPIVDVVDVPPGLDPEGTYYRPGHQQTVEIRQGKWKYYRPKD